jgi:hypothetical protein
VNEDEEPQPISTEAVEPGEQEVVDSTALEEALGIDDAGDEDEGGEAEDFLDEDDGPDSVDELLDDDPYAG